MFEKWKETIKANKQYQQVNAHVQEHKFAYAVGAGVVGGTVLGAGGLLAFQDSAEIKQVIKPKNIMGLGYKSPQVMNTIVLPAKGDPGDVVQNLRTLETFPSKGELARHLNVPRRLVSRYFNDEISDLLGDQYSIIGKAGHPIQLA
jgi:hypothetical protein